MQRPQPTTVKCKVPCPQCKEPMDTTYECKWDGRKTVELVEISCKCGYSYFSTASYVQGA